MRDGVQSWCFACMVAMSLAFIAKLSSLAFIETH